MSTPRCNLHLLTPGVHYMVASAFFFSVMSLFVKVLGQRLPSQEIVLARGLISLVLTLGMIRRVGVAPWGTRKGILLLRGMLGFAALNCFYFALTRLPLAEATMLQYTSPIWTALIAALLLGEAVTKRVFGASLISFIGVALITRPAFLFGELAADLDLTVVGIALVGALLSSGAFVAIRKASRTEHSLVIILYFSLLSTIGPLPLVAPVAILPRGAERLVLLGVGVATQAAQVFLTRGLSLVPAGRAMSIAYLQILFAAFWGALFFSEVPDLWTVIGAMAVILASAAVSFRDGALQAG